MSTEEKQPLTATKMSKVSRPVVLQRTIMIFYSLLVFSRHQENLAVPKVRTTAAVMNRAAKIAIMMSEVVKS